MNSAPACTCKHHAIVPVLVILLGLVFVLQNMGVVSAELAQQAWPILVVLIGLVKLMSGGCKCYMHGS